MKKKWLKIPLYAAGVIILLIICALSYVKFALPNVGPPPTMKIEGTAAQIERGAYLANNVMGCIDCHSPRDFTLFGGPIKPGTEGMGGEVFDQSFGLPGSYVSANLTPHHLGDWTDGEIFRAVTTGVNKDGKALFPIMPYHNFGTVDKEDIKSVIAYLRTLKSIKNDTEPSVSDFPMNFIINLIPHKANLSPAPPRSDIIAYGKYLVTAGTCNDCHTKQDDKGNFVGPDLGGGNEFHMGNGTVVRAVNITPHETGIGNWPVEQFVQRFKAFTDSSYVHKKVNDGDFQTIMPWFTYAGMTEEDLRAIYAYLKTLPPADNVVERFTAAR